MTSIPYFERVDLGGDLEISRSGAQDAGCCMVPTPPDDERVSWQEGHLYPEAFDSQGASDAFHQPQYQFGLSAQLPTWSDPYMLPQGTLPALLALYNGLGTDLPQQILKAQTAEQPPATPSYDTWSYGGYYGGGGGGGDDNNFPGGGINNHQPTQQWTDAPVQAEASTSLAPAKPKRIENNTQPEQSSTPAAPSSRGSYNRSRNNEEKKLRRRQICEALGIASTEGEFVTLQKVIKRLGGTIPDVEESSTWTTRADQAKRRRAAVQACYKELQRLVGPPVDKLAYLKVLNNVLERVMAQGGQRKYNPYGVFCLETW